MQAHLVLSDWTIFSWENFWYEGNTEGEVVFTTGMVGYPETLTDPSFVGQILCLTYPLQGNYGVPDFENFDQHGLRLPFESDAIHIQALIVNHYSPEYNHREASQSLGEFLTSQKIPGITGIDTRTLTKKLREEGVMLGHIIIGELEKIKTKSLTFSDPNERNLVAEVSCDEVITYGKGKKRICLLDVGVKNNIVRSLLEQDTTVIRVPHDYPFMDWSIEFDGLFLSNGPGDPEKNTIAIEQIQIALERGTHIFGICLGNQLLALAAWAKTYKLKYGHRGQNQPCKDIHNGTCVITSQNHGFAVDNTTLPKWIQPWFVNINDETNEGMIFDGKHVRSVQFHPESAPGPNDTAYLFKEFVDSL